MSKLMARARPICCASHAEATTPPAGRHHAVRERAASIYSDPHRLSQSRKKGSADLFSRSAAFPCPCGTSRGPTEQSLMSLRDTPKDERDPSPDLILRPPSPLGRGKSSYPSLSAGERVAAMRRRVRGHFSEQVRATTCPQRPSILTEPGCWGEKT
jgi:hypothetical protein